MAVDRHEPVELRLLGPIEVRRAGAVQALPASRKTRALLAWLAISGRPQRRERLCEIFWEVPDDPRGALRWSLSKLRSVLNDEKATRLVADREWVELVLPDEAVDWRRLRNLVQAGPASASTEAIEGALGDGALLEGLDLFHCDSFQSWCVAQREDVRKWRASLLAELGRREIAPDRALRHARLRVEIEPEEPAAWQHLVDLLGRAGRGREADEQRVLGARRLASAGRKEPIKALAGDPSPAQRCGETEIRFCTSSDGTGLAYALAGEGPPIVKIANWMTHLELDAQGPIWRHWIAEFSRGRTLLRYDQRGNGLSDWATRFDFEAYVADLEAVVDAAAIDRFDLLGLSQGAAVAIAYAVRHPDRVRRLLLVGGFARGWRVRGDPDEIARREAMITLTREGWGLDNPAFRQMFTSLFLPDSGPDEQAWFNDKQRVMTSPENACAIQREGGATDVADLLSQVAAPTLVAHCREDAMVPFEAGRALAQGIPGASFLPLEGRNHVLLEGDAAWRRFAAAARSFLSE